MTMTAFQLLTQDAPNTSQDVVMFWLLFLLYTEPNTSFQIYMKCIDRGNVLDDRWSYSKKKNVWYQFHPSTKAIGFIGNVIYDTLVHHVFNETLCHQPNGGSLPNITEDLQNEMDEPCYVLRLIPQIESKPENSSQVFWLKWVRSDPNHHFYDHHRQLYHQNHAM